MVIALIVVPLAAALLAFLMGSERVRPWLLPPVGAAHVALSMLALRMQSPHALDGWLRLDSLGKLLLAFTSVLFFACSIYAPGYIAFRRERPNRLFCASLLVFLAMMTVIIEAHHLGLLWVAFEACTLATAPLIYFKRTPRSIEALWKYMILGSVGIALALLGSLFLAYSALHAGLRPSLLLDDLMAIAPKLSRPWLHAAFIVLFIGYGTKMGLAPMHVWKPDAYGEAPGLAGTLLAGGLTSCAFIAILRLFGVCVASGNAVFARQMMVAAGLLSMTVGSIFMIRQRDYKRMLAYSSVEHMGILVLGVGIGGAGVFGALLHLVGNGFAKGVLFLSAGNLHRAYGSKLIDDVSGALRRLPASGALFLVGFFAVTGLPPFSIFTSELTILSAAFLQGRFLVAAAFLVMLALVFTGMATTVLAVVQGEPSPAASGTSFEDTSLTVAPIVLFTALVLLLGVYLPHPVETLLREAAASVDTP